MNAVYFSHQNPQSPMSAFAADINKDIHNFWLQLINNDNHDADSLVVELMRITGQSRTDINHALNAVYAMNNLPQLRRLQEAHYFLSINYLSRIMIAVAQAGPALWKELDRRIADRLTPRVADEMLIQQGALAGLITKWIKELDPEFKNKENGSAKDYLVIEHKNGATYFRGKLNPHDGHYFHQVLLKLRTGKDTLAQCLMRLLDTKSIVRVVRNIFTPTSGGLSWIPGVGYGDPPPEVDSERSLDRFATTIEQAYSPSVGLRNFVIARDGTCRAPGCNVPADCCQLDHVIAYGDGGTTSADNLVCLCQRHHNMKTDKRWNTSLSSGAELRWVGPMSVPVVTTPTGPLTAEMPISTWGQTVESRMKARCSRIFDHAH